MAKKFVNGLISKASGKKSRAQPTVQYNIVINSGSGPEKSSNNFGRQATNINKNPKVEQTEKKARQIISLMQ